MKVAIIGLGLIGGSIARRLHDFTTAQFPHTTEHPKLSYLQSRTVQ